MPGGPSPDAPPDAAGSASGGIGRRGAPSAPRGPMGVAARTVFLAGLAGVGAAVRRCRVGSQTTQRKVCLADTCCLGGPGRLPLDPKRFDGWTRLGTAPTPAKTGKGRFGCTKQDDICRTNIAVPCPDAPDGVCAVNTKGKPACISTGIAPCQACKRNADCASRFGPTAHCVKCPVCRQVVGVGTACFVPLAH
jgi:hypothetical protein